MLVKVCGMREPDNIQNLAHLRTDLVGFIFYEKSSRFVETEGVDPELHKSIYGYTDLVKIPKVGVFVNAEVDYVLEKIKEYHLDYVQLHGQENLFYCQKLKKKGVKIIKAFSVDDHFNFSQTKGYEPLCDFFLFDTKGKNPGGNGFTFNWEVLQNYKGTTPFLLSGGIGPESVPALQKFKHPRWAGLDLNSRFESAPAKKELWQIQQFLKELREAQILKTNLPNWD